MAPFGASLSSTRQGKWKQSVKASVQTFVLHGPFRVNNRLCIQGPAATVDVVRRIVGEQDVSANADTAKSAEGEKVEKETEDGKTNAQEIEQRKVANGDEARADVAAEVADSAQMLDGAVEA